MHKPVPPEAQAVIDQSHRIATHARAAADEAGLAFVLERSRILAADDGDRRHVYAGLEGQAYRDALVGAPDDGARGYETSALGPWHASVVRSFAWQRRQIDASAESLGEIAHPAALTYELAWQAVPVAGRGLFEAAASLYVEDFKDVAWIDNRIRRLWAIEDRALAHDWRAASTRGTVDGAGFSRRVHLTTYATAPSLHERTVLLLRTQLRRELDLSAWTWVPPALRAELVELADRPSARGARSAGSSPMAIARDRPQTDVPRPHPLS